MSDGALRRGWQRSGLVLGGLLAFLTASQVQAGVRRYHFVPNAPPNVSMKPVQVYGSPAPPPRANTQVTFKHPYTGQMITVPLQLPEDTPRIEHRFTRVIYDYGSDTVEIVFQQDGTVDVLYNTGFLRAP